MFLTGVWTYSILAFFHLIKCYESDHRVYLFLLTNLFASSLDTECIYFYYQKLLDKFFNNLMKICTFLFENMSQARGVLVFNYWCIWRESGSRVYFPSESFNNQYSLLKRISANSGSAQLVLGSEFSNYYFHTYIWEDAEDDSSEW